MRARAPNQATDGLRLVRQLPVTGVFCWPINIAMNKVLLVRVDADMRSNLFARPITGAACGASGMCRWVSMLALVFERSGIGIAASSAMLSEIEPDVIASCPLEKKLDGGNAVVAGGRRPALHVRASIASKTSVLSLGVAGPDTLPAGNDHPRVIQGEGDRTREISASQVWQMPPPDLGEARQRSQPYPSFDDLKWRLTTHQPIPQSRGR